MTCFAGKCVGGPLDGQPLATHSNWVRMPVRRGSLFPDALKKPPVFVSGDVGLYQYIAGEFGIGTWDWKGRPE